MHHITIDDIYLINIITKQGSFAKAAEQLNIPRPNVTRRVKQLEEHLGVMLFHRSTRKLTLTPEGEAFILHSKAIEQEWQTALDKFQLKNAVPSGRLKIWGEGVISCVVSGKLLSDFISQYPNIQLEFYTSYNEIHVKKFEADILIDTMPLDDKSFVSEPVNMIVGDFYASPTYLARNGVPKHPEELKNYDLIQHQSPAVRSWCYTENGERKYLEVESRLQFEELSSLLNMVLMDHGITLMPSFLCADYVKEGKLVRLFEGRYQTEFNIYAIYPRTQFLANRIQLFLEMLKRDDLIDNSMYRI